jgi:hypothetical protein
MATILNAIASDLEDLSATHTLCAAFGTTFTDENLLLGFEQESDVDVVTIIPFGGTPPNNDGYRQDTYVQVRMKVTSRQVAIEAHQELINYLHNNQLNGNGKVFALQSAPSITDAHESGKWVVSTSNYSIKHVKI